MARISDIPINPEEIREGYVHHLTTGEPSESLLTPTCCISVPAQHSFVLIRELGNAIYAGTRWNKKARIVLEYDPSYEKMSIMTFMESSELAQEAGRESC